MSTRLIRAVLGAALAIASSISVRVQAQVPAQEYAARRATLLAGIDSGIVLAYGEVDPVSDWPTFFQLPHFHYLTGFDEGNAVLLMVKRGGGFGDMLAHDGHVADLPVTLSEIEVGETDGSRIVRDLGLLQGAVVERNGPRLFAAREGDAAMQAPQIRVQDRRNSLAQGVRRPSEHGSGLCKIALQEVRFSQHDPDTELVVLGKSRWRP